MFRGEPFSASKERSSFLRKVREAKYERNFVIEKDLRICLEARRLLSTSDAYLMVRKASTEVNNKAYEQIMRSGYIKIGSRAW